MHPLNTIFTFHSHLSCTFCSIYAFECTIDIINIVVSSLVIDICLICALLFTLLFRLLVYALFIAPCSFTIFAVRSEFASIKVASHTFSRVLGGQGCEKVFCVMRKWTLCQVKKELTEAGVDEAVPAAAAAPQQPPSADARREAEGGAEHAHQHVAHAYVQQQHVHRRPQLLEFAKEQKDDEVVEEAKSHDGAQRHGQHRKARGGELSVRLRVRQLPVIAQVEAVIQTIRIRKHPAVQLSPHCGAALIAVAVFSPEKFMSSIFKSPQCVSSGVHF